MTCTPFTKLARHRITIEAPIEVTTPTGGRSVTWDTIGTYYAMITPSNGRELFSQQGIQTQITSKMVIRYRADLKNASQISDYRISFDGRLFGIVALNNLHDDMKTEGRSYQSLYVVENAPDTNG